jgi:hypothetical protein
VRRGGKTSSQADANQGVNETEPGFAALQVPAAPEEKDTGVAGPNVVGKNKNTPYCGPRN